MRKLKILMVAIFALGVCKPVTLVAQVPNLHQGPVFLIVGENLDYQHVDKATAPYITQVLQPQSAWVVNFFGLSHGSLSDYIGMTSGQFTPCDEDNGSPFDCHQNVDNLFSQLTRQGQSDWKQWMESMPEPCRLTYIAGSPSTLNYFTVNHSPAVYYDEVVGDYANPSDYCKLRVAPAGTLEPGDWSGVDESLTNGSLSDFELVIQMNCVKV